MNINAIELLEQTSKLVQNNNLPQSILSEIAKGYSYNVSQIKVEGVVLRYSDGELVFNFELPNGYDAYDCFEMSVSEVNNMILNHIEK